MLPSRKQHTRQSFARCQRRAHEFLIIAREDALVGKSRVAPDQVPSKRGSSWLQQLATADLLVPRWRQSGQDEISCFTHQEETAAVLDQEGGAVPQWLVARRGRPCFPEPFSRFQLNRPELALPAAATVDHAVLQERGAVGAV